MDRRPTLSKRVREGLLILATNPCAAEHITEVQRLNITGDELQKARIAYQWVMRMQEFANNARPRNQPCLADTPR